MAEKVTVRGGGTIDGAEFGNAATEATLLRLLDALRGKKDGASGDEAKLKELANRALRENTEQLGGNSSAQTDASKTVSGMSTAAKSAGSVLGKLGDGVSTLASGVFSLAVSAGTQLIGFLNNSLDAFRETSSVGASFNNSMIEMRVAAANAGMPLEQFTALIGKNSKLMASYGGTVTQGANAFLKMSTTIKDSEFGQQMQGLGMTTGDLDDYLSGYLEVEQRNGRLKNGLDAQARIGAQEYMVEMDKLTKLTGVSRQASQDALRNAMKDGRSMNLASKLSGQALTNFKNGLTLMNTTLDPSSLGSLTNMMSGVIDPGDRFAKMLSQASPGILDFQRAMGKGTLSTKDMILGYREQRDSIENYLSGFSDEQIARDSNLKQLREYQASLEKYKDMNIEEAEKEQAQKDKLTKGMASFGRIFDKIIGGIQSAFLTGDTFTKIEKGLGSLADKFLKYAPQIGDMFADLVTDIDAAFNTNGSIWDGVGAAFGKLFDKIRPVVSGLFKSLITGMFGKGGDKKSAGAGAGGSSGGATTEDIDPGPFDELMKGMKESYPIIGKIETAVNAVGWAFENMNLVLLGGAGAIFALSKFGSIGKMLGGIGEGILTGIALGLKAFANPQTAIGALILAGAIVVIGGAVAAATWMMGKALPTFAEGMKSFEDLNGENLIKVGNGIGAVGIGLMEFGAGEIVGGLGGIIGNWAESLNKGKSLFEKLQDFQKMDLDAAKIESNATAVVAYGKAMAALGAGGAMGSIGGLVSSAVDGIRALFGGQAMPWDKLKEFGNLQLDKEKIVKNAEILTLFSNSINTFSNAGSSSITSIGADFASQATGVNTFTESIKKLNKAIVDLNAALATISSSGKGILGGGQSNLEVVTQALGGAAGANTGGGPASEKLNTLLAELVALTKEIKDSSKDQADALNGRRTPI